MTDHYAVVKDSIRNILNRSRRVLVVSHVDPDGDALGTQLAFGAYLKDEGKEVFMMRDSDIPGKYAFLPNVDQIKTASSWPDDLLVDTAVILECPKPDRIGSARRFISEDTTVINIDHHPNGLNMGDVNWNNTEASSVGEMVYEYFEYVNYNINSDVAQQLYTAILTDTGRFKYSSTSPRTMTIAGQLIAAGADPHEICDHVYYNLPPSTMKLIGRVLNGIEFHCKGRLCLLTLSQKMLAEAGADAAESDGLVDFTLYTKGVQTGALLKEIDSNCTKASLRSIDGINVSSIAAKYGGGGHYNAAGCTMPYSLEEAKTQLLDCLSEVCNEAS